MENAKTGNGRLDVVDSPAPAGKTSPEDFMGFVVQYFKLDPQFFLGKTTNKPRDVNVKHMVRFYLWFHYKGLSFVEIGNMTCRSHHSTVMHSCKKHKDYLRHDPVYRRAYEPFRDQARALGYGSNVSPASS